LLFIPSHAPYDYYTKEYEKGLQLYANGVLIMNKCSDLLPDYFGFVKGLVDSEDLSLNISREMLQQDRRLGLIAKNIEKKIKTELEGMLEENREKYEQFFKAFGMQLKFGVYNNFGMDKDKLKEVNKYAFLDINKDYYNKMEDKIKREIKRIGKEEKNNQKQYKEVVEKVLTKVEYYDITKKLINLKLINGDKI